MSPSMHDASAPLFLRGLDVLDHLLDKAAASGIDEETLFEARLAPDMKPFPDQVRFAAFGARSCVARLSGCEWPKTDDSEASIAELKQTVALSREFVAAASPDAFAGSETRPVALRFPGVGLDFLGSGYLTSFALPNFYFHLTTAYAILRAQGVVLGKPDFLGQLDLTAPPILG